MNLLRLNQDQTGSQVQVRHLLELLCEPPPGNPGIVPIQNLVDDLEPVIFD
jgi:hypothetical protein